MLAFGNPFIIPNINPSGIICTNKAPVNTVSFRPVTNPPTMRRTIKGTEYIVTGSFAPDATETAEEIMRRIILNAKIED